MDRRWLAFILVIGIALVFTALPVSGQGVLRVTTPARINDAVEGPDGTWFALSRGAERLSQNRRESFLTELKVYSVASQRNAVWLGTEKGLYRIEGNRPIAEEGMLSAEVVTALLATDDALYVGTRRGLFVKHGPTLTQLDKSAVIAMRKIGDRVWVASQDNALVFGSGEQLQKIFPGGGVEVTSIHPTKDRVWLVTANYLNTPGSTYEVANTGDLLPHELTSLQAVSSVAEVSGEVWMTAASGLFRLVDGKPEKVVAPTDDPLNSIDEVSGVPWLSTSERAYYRNTDGTWQEIAPLAQEMGVHKVVALGGDIYWLTDKGSFRFEKKMAISVDLSAFSLGLVDANLGKLLSSQGITPHDVGVGPPLPSPEVLSFRIAAAASRNALEEEIRRRLFTPQERWNYAGSFGPSRVALAVADQVGNLWRLPEHSVLFIPAWSLIVGGVPLAWLLGALVALAVAPWHRGLLGWALKVRGVPSLFLINALLHSKRVQRHVLQHYMLTKQRILQVERGARLGLEEAAAAETIKLETNGKYRLFSGSGKAGPLLDQLEGRAVLGKVLTLERESLIPVRISAVAYTAQGLTLREAALAQLVDQGGIQDLDIAEAMLHQGDFLFLLDARREIPADEAESVGNAIDVFVAAFQSGNCIVLAAPATLTTDSAIVWNELSEPGFSIRHLASELR